MTVRVSIANAAESPAAIDLLAVYDNPDMAPEVLPSLAPGETIDVHVWPGREIRIREAPVKRDDANA